MLYLLESFEKQSIGFSLWIMNGWNLQDQDQEDVDTNEYHEVDLVSWHDQRPQFNTCPRTYQSKDDGEICP